MAGNVKVTFVGDISDLKRKMETLDKSLGTTATGLEKFSTKMAGIGSSLTSFGKTLTLGVTLPIVGLGVKAVSAFNASEEAATKLSTNLLNVKGNTLENVKAIDKLAKSLQRKGVIDDDSIIAGASQLATFNLQGKTIEKLTPKITDMVAQIKGYNATSQDVVAINNLVGKAMTGSAGALTRYGVTLTDAQKKTIKYGDETERANVIVEALSQNFGSVNEELAKTGKGKWKQFLNQLDDLLEGLGSVLSQTLIPAFKAVAPYISKLSENFEKLPAPAKTIIVIIGLLAAAIGPLILVLGSLSTAMAALAANPVVLIIAAIILVIGAFVAILVVLYNKNEAFRKFVTEAWQKISEKIKELWETLLKPALTELKAAWDEMVASVKEFVEKNPEVAEMLKVLASTGVAIVLFSIVSAFRSLVSVIQVATLVMRGITVVIDLISDAFSRLRNAGVSTFEAISGPLGRVKNFIDKILEKIDPLIEGFKKITGISPGSMSPLLKVLGRAMGGRVTAGTPYIVGEGGGPEMFVPETDGHIVNARQTRNMGAGTTNNFYFAGKADVTEAEIIRQMKRYESLRVA